MSGGSSKRISLVLLLVEYIQVALEEVGLIASSFAALSPSSCLGRVVVSVNFSAETDVCPNLGYTIKCLLSTCYQVKYFSTFLLENAAKFRSRCF